ncbi:MAG TPA: HEAT repeat domain-containing protein [Candidatus Acidoferrales bacterium]|nr:HEAT repeat domain-containing protein [Candidatus Acidoferrales bacterium]HXK02052.1 HEAT repeat domain-containing protein [Verrucomicrobiae bacterium]
MTRFFLITVASVSLLSAQTPADRSWKILEDAIGSDKTDPRGKAVRALGLITNNARARQLAEHALSDPKTDVQAAAADALGQMGARQSIPKLIEAIKSNDAAVVFAAANALYVLKDPRAYEIYYAVLMGERKTGEGLVDSQMKMIKDPKAMARMGFEAGVGFIPFGGAGLAVFKMVTKDDTSPVRAAAALKLAGDPDPKSAEALMQMASDKKWLVRAAVVDAIAKRGDPSLLKAVWPLLNDDEDTVRFTAAGAILRLTK